jgi:hypothetical protein
MLSMLFMHDQKRKKEHWNALITKRVPLQMQPLIN